MSKSTRRPSDLKPADNGQLPFDRADAAGRGDAPGVAGPAGAGATDFAFGANLTPGPDKPADALADFAPAEPPPAASVPDPEELARWLAELRTPGKD